MTWPSSSASRRSGQHRWSQDRERTSLGGGRRRRDRHPERLFRGRAGRIRGFDDYASRHSIGHAVGITRAVDVAVAARIESIGFAGALGLGLADRVS
jgi:hypothetical protein